MAGASEDRVRTNREMLRIRDLLDRDYAEPVDISTLARQAAMSPDHLIRTFSATFGETPHRYLQRRRVERAMFLLRTTDLPVTEVCLRVGYDSLGAFSQLFSSIVGVSPSAYRADDANHPPDGPHNSFVKRWTRPSTHTHPSISRKRAPGGDA
ncbi:MAG: AraC family transcriptional regulator [Gordonia amarae]